MEPIKSDFLVIGGGIAGLLFAIKAADFGTVTVLTKAASDEANTAYAQGGIASVWSIDDSFESHVSDTLRAGDGLCNRHSVETIIREGPAAVRELIALGTHFTRIDAGGEDEYDLGREGGHSHRRVLHAQDLTGREIMRALGETAAARSNIEFLENHVAVNLLINSHRLTNCACWGAYALNKATMAVRKVVARTTMLATGGAGKVYLYTTNPDIASGDGVAMAHRAGIPIANMEFYQFHPTCLYHPAAKSFLISEALRGEGAILRLPDGTAFMKRYHPDAELAPRDVVARAIVHELELQHSPDATVYLDLTHLNADRVRSRFPTIYATCMQYNIDIATELVPVRPAAHYSMGGVHTDLEGRTSIPGLYAAGEVACTGVHGANRLASNSLLEGLVYGARAAARMRDELKSERDGWSDSVMRGASSSNGNAAEAEQFIRKVQSLMWQHAGVVREGKSLRQLIADLTQLQQHAPRPSSRISREAANIVETGLIIARSALAREESRGAHYRLDFPLKDDAKFHKHSVVAGESIRFE